MERKGLLAVPLTLAALVAAWFGVGAMVYADPPDIGPAVVITPAPPPAQPAPSAPPEPTGGADVVPPPAPKPAGCDPDDDPDDEDWCGPGYGDEDDG